MSLVVPVAASSSYAVPQNEDFFEEIYGVQVPECYIDPVTYAIMEDPVTLFPSGRTYDRSTVESLEEGVIVLRDPETKQPVQRYATNKNLKDCIDQFFLEHPELKEALEKEKAEIAKQQKILNYTTNTFAALFNEKNTVIIPANTEVCIYNIHKIFTWEYINSNFDPVYFTRIISNILFPLGKRFEKISSKAVVNTIIAGENTSHYLTLKSEEDIVLTASSQTLKISVRDFFDRMIQASKTTLCLEPNQPIFFSDISEVDKNIITKNPNQNFIPYLLTKCPKEITSFSINASDLNWINDYPNMFGLVSSTGILINLQIAEREASSNFS